MRQSAASAAGGTAQRSSDAGLARVVAGAGGGFADRPARDRQARGDRLARRAWGHQPLRLAQAADGLSRPGSERAFSSGASPAPGGHYPHWERPCAAHAGRIGLELPLPGPPNDAPQAQGAQRLAARRRRSPGRPRCACAGATGPSPGPGRTPSWCAWPSPASWPASSGTSCARRWRVVAPQAG